MDYKLNTYQSFGCKTKIFKKEDVNMLDKEVVLGTGYHTTSIKRGVYGEFSKLEEELCEIEDAIVQGNRIMELNELSDLYGALEAYVETKHKGYTINDLAKMSQATKKAFADGHRVNRDGTN
jgi:hypothetical protein